MEEVIDATNIPETFVMAGEDFNALREILKRLLKTNDRKANFHFSYPLDEKFYGDVHITVKSLLGA